MQLSDYILYMYKMMIMLYLFIYMLDVCHMCVRFDYLICNTSLILFSLFKHLLQCISCWEFPLHPKHLRQFNM